MAVRKIPAWQQAPAPPSTSSSPPGSEESTPPPSPPAEAPSTEQQAPGAEESAENSSMEEKSSLIEQASKFLQDPSIRDAPRERKVAFLQSKGLSSEDIQTLLGPEQAADMPGNASKLWSQNLKSSPRPQQQQPPPRDIPPIVTYPEFLAKPQKPPPLITVNRLLNTSYAIGSLYALVYAASKYLIAPMEASLTDARHDFATHSQSHLDTLNERLSGMVSTVPKGTGPTAPGTARDGDATDDAESIDSDPTELFHRDHGTQTSPSLSRRPSSSASSSSAALTTPQKALAAHENRLKILNAHLSELAESAASTDSSTKDLSTAIDDLRSYLTDLSYASPYAGGGLYGGYGGEAGKKGDAVEALKGDIRAVKGVLLSARNFPRAGGR